MISSALFIPADIPLHKRVLKLSTWWLRAAFDAIGKGISAHGKRVLREEMLNRQQHKDLANPQPVQKHSLGPGNYRIADGTKVSTFYGLSRALFNPKLLGKCFFGAANVTVSSLSSRLSLGENVSLTWLLALKYISDITMIKMRYYYSNPSKYGPLS